jgi:hypothetical protein
VDPSASQLNGFWSGIVWSVPRTNFYFPEKVHMATMLVVIKYVDLKGVA